MTRRKTIEVAYLKDKINNYLREKEASLGERVALCILLESVLMDTKNYKGFRYLCAQELPEGVTAGIIASDVPGESTFPDQYRRQYY